MRQRRDRKEMAALLARRERLGLTWAALSEESDIPLGTLYKWRRRLRAAGRRRGRRFVAVTVSAGEGGVTDAALEVVLRSGHRVWVTAGFDPEHLRRVVTALESCSA